MAFSTTDASYFVLGVCAAATVLTGRILRSGVPSLGLPYAYVVLLLLEHAPGAWAAAVREETYRHTALVQTGINLTAAGICAFIVGVWSARRTMKRQLVGTTSGSPTTFALPRRFVLFCLVGGWIITFAVRAAVNVPSVNALIDQGGAIWLLAVMAGIADGVKRQSVKALMLWGSALLVYPAFVLVVGGFLSWGSAAIVIALSILCVVVQRYWIFLVGSTLAALIGLSIFVNYFAVRPEIRAAAWGGAPISERAAASGAIFTHFEILSAANPAHMKALDQRLNQNYFIGLAALRLERGQVEFLQGRSLYEGMLALIPRIIWPEKPVYGGSGDIVPEMTGLHLERTRTAWGVGSVMEFYVNFGVPGVITGFLLLGFLLARLDTAAAQCIAEHNYGRSLPYFLSCAALIQPLGSIVELSGGAAAALLAGMAWRWLWAKLAPASTAAAMQRPTSAALLYHAANRLRNSRPRMTSIQTPGSNEKLP